MTKNFHHCLKLEIPECVSPVILNIVIASTASNTDLGSRLQAKPSEASECLWAFVVLCIKSSESYRLINECSATELHP